MPNLRDIKQRIVSVKKTQKITLAMKMVAAAKFKRAQDTLKDSLNYADELGNIITDLSSRVTLDDLPALATPNESNKEAIIIIAGDRGLCGGFNSSILKSATHYLNKKTTEDVSLTLVGNKSALHFKNKSYKIDNVYRNIPKGIKPELLEEILNPIIDDYLNGKYGKVTLFYNKFISALASEQKSITLFPLNVSNSNDSNSQEGEGESDFIYEPSKEIVLSDLIKLSSITQLHIGLLNSRAAEEGSRMAAMDSASQNASDVIYQLTLSYNRGRQAAITTEISEIVAGAASLK